MIKFLKIWNIGCIVGMAATSASYFFADKGEVGAAWAVATLWGICSYNNLVDWIRMREAADDALKLAHLAADQAYANQERLNVIDANRYKNMMK